MFRELMEFDLDGSIRKNIVLKKQIILIADDDSMSRDFIKTVFERYFSKYVIETYNTGEAVEQRFGDKGFDGVKFVVLDEVMDPGLRGLELIKKYSSLARSSGCKMILYTGEGKELGERAIKEGAFAYISKPISLNKLEGIIKTALVEEKTSQQ